MNALPMNREIYCPIVGPLEEFDGGTVLVVEADCVPEVPGGSDVVVLVAVLVSGGLTHNVGSVVHDGGVGGTHKD